MSNGGNDSLAYKVDFYDFRGEKGRDKTLDISPKRFNSTMYQTSQERVDKAVKQAGENFFNEKYHRKEEIMNQQLRQVSKAVTSPVGFQ